MGSYLINKLARYFPQIKLLTDVDLSSFSYIGVGGKGELMIFPKTIDEIKDVIEFLSENNIKFIVLGKCSNILFSDKEIDKIFIKTDFLKNIVINKNIVTAECGVGLSNLSLTVAKQSLSGLEFLCGIPGSIGGGVAMNCSAFNFDIMQNIKSVTYLYKNKVITAKKDDISYGYRNSQFLNSDKIILSVEFELANKPCAEVLGQINSYVSKRQINQPQGKTLGSTFKNGKDSSGEEYFAGKIIESVGLKGFKIGGAEVSEKHANFIINSGNANSKDIKKLIEYIKNKVEMQTGIKLEEEVRFIGDF